MTLMKMSLWMEERLEIAVMVGQMPDGDTREMLVGLKVSNMSNDIHCMMGTFMLGRLSSATVAIKMLATSTSCKRSTSAPGHIPTSIKRHPEAPCTYTHHPVSASIIPSMIKWFQMNHITSHHL
ncbi:hypothetical protein AAC387_Pa01g1996 [Persea americana]